MAGRPGLLAEAAPAATPLPGQTAIGAQPAPASVRQSTQSRCASFCDVPPAQSTRLQRGQDRVSPRSRLYCSLQSRSMPPPLLLASPRARRAVLQPTLSTHRAKQAEMVVHWSYSRVTRCGTRARQKSTSPTLFAQIRRPCKLIWVRLASSPPQFVQGRAAMAQQEPEKAARRGVADVRRKIHPTHEGAGAGGAGASAARPQGAAAARRVLYSVFCMPLTALALAAKARATASDAWCTTQAGAR